MFEFFRNLLSKQNKLNAALTVAYTIPAHSICSYHNITMHNLDSDLVKNNIQK